MDTDHYLTKKEIAALFGAGTSDEAAEKELRKAGVYPIRLGTGKIRRKRWLQSAVIEAMQRLHEKAQPKAKQTIPRPRKTPNLAAMSTADIARLVSPPLASGTPIQ